MNSGHTYASYEEFRKATLQEILRRTFVQKQREAEVIFSRRPREIPVSVRVVGKLTEELARATYSEYQKIVLIEQDGIKIVVFCNDITYFLTSEDIEERHIDML